MLSSMQISRPYTEQLFQMLTHSLPEHKRFLDLRLSLLTDENADFFEKLCHILFKIKEDSLEACFAGYQWMHTAILDEELYFRRHKRYRLTSFEEALNNVYSNPVIMKKYMDGVLLSQVLWANHTAVLQFFYEDFLEKIQKAFSLLEIGPGHGLFLYFAMCVKNCSHVVGWDISESSLALTRKALNNLSSSTKFRLERQNIFDCHSNETFDVIVLSEILEHVENPKEALIGLKPRLNQGGRLFINIPCNSPAPDHIFLFRHPDEVFSLIRDCGYQIEHSELFPATGLTLQKALDKDLTISGVAIITI